MTKKLFPNEEWTVDELDSAWNNISKIARNDLGLDFYEPEIHLITYDQALGLYSSHFLPNLYPHWSFGKIYSVEKENYVNGRTSLPYEVIINTDPAIMYLMENNTSTMQMITMSHAGCGHSSFFKNNFLFKAHTDPKFILPYANYARNYIQECEHKYGVDRVAYILDACHSLQHHGVFKYKRKHYKKDELRKQLSARKKFMDENYNELEYMFESTPSKPGDYLIGNKNVDLSEYLESLEYEHLTRAQKYGLPQENLLYFIEKNSVVLSEWQKEIVRIVRKIAQYFYPQYMTKLMNEGYASFVHYELMTLLYEKKLMSEGQYIEFLHSHCGVINQPDYSATINPYKLGFEIFSNIKKVCLTPSKDDYYWFPDIAGTKDWKKAIDFAMKNFMDESFILQYLSIDTVDKLQMFSFIDNTKKDHYVIRDTQNAEGFRSLRKTIAEHYNIAATFPSLEILDYEPYYHKIEIQVSKHKYKDIDDDSWTDTEKYLKNLLGCDMITYLININYDS